MQCRIGCGACCIALSISSSIPGMAQGKPAGVVCVQLDSQRRCRLFGQPQRPEVCTALSPAGDICGDSTAQAMTLIAALELATEPDHVVSRC
jgi:hypothetical protein